VGDRGVYQSQELCLGLRLVVENTFGEVNELKKDLLLIVDLNLALLYLKVFERRVLAF